MWKKRWVIGYITEQIKTQTMNIQSLETELIALAETHKCEYSNHLHDEDDERCFTFLKYNVPLLADVRMLAEKYGLDDCVETDGGWGYVALYVFD